MKTEPPWRHAIHPGLGFLAGLCLLAWTPQAILSTASAATQSKAPVFPEMPRPATPAAPAVQPPPQALEPTNAPPPSPPPTPADQVQESAQGKTLFSFQATDLELKSALATFARANKLNIVPDYDVTGVVTLDVSNLPLEVMMRALLDAADCSWQEEGGLIRVRNTETRTFAVDYLRLSRKGVGQSSALLASGTSGGNTGGGMGGGMGGGGIGGGGGAQGAISYGSSSVNLTADNPIDFWKELKTELASLLTEPGKQSLAMNMTAGLVQVTDRPSALRKVESYLKSVDKSVHRQVEIEARLYDVTLNSQFQFGIDWVHVAKAYGGMLGFGGATLPAAIGGAQLQNSAISGLNRLPLVGDTTLGNNLATLVFTNFNTKGAINALEEQGKVEVISTPRLRTLNNQTALIKVGEDVPFFNTSTIVQQSGTIQPLTSVNVMVTSITIGTILSLTPQVSDDDWISLDISPVLTSLKAIVNAPPVGGATENTGTSTGTTAPDLQTKQASTLVRVRDGTTVVLGGLIQTQTAKNLRKVPLLGDIPLLGKLFTGTFDSKQKEELVIFVTPHIVREGEPSVNPRLEDRQVEPKAKM